MVTAKSRSIAWLSAGFGFAISIVAMEALLHGIELSPAWRILPIVERELGWPDPDRGYALRPNIEIINVREHRSQVSTNSFGMRDKERTLAKSPRVYRVVVTGDSFTEALQVNDPDTFTRLAEASDDDGSNSEQFEFLNFGMSGAGPVQQYVQLQNLALKFNPDAIVMLIGAGQFLSSEMSDDSVNPAYIKNADGELELGYTFRQRRSQRYRDTLVGRLFFRLMDSSRIARALYVYKLSGGKPVPRTGSEITAHSCSAIDARIERQLKLWQEHAPMSAYARVEKFVADLAHIKRERDIPMALVVYGIGEIRPDCNTRRQALISAMERVLTPHALRLWDADGVLSTLEPTLAPLAHYHGFGRKRGIGHLNHAGHRAYSQLLRQIADELKTSDHR